MADDDGPDREAARARSAEIPLHGLLGLDYEVPEEGAGFAEVRMPVRSEAYGFTANLHGGAIATLVDVSCGLAAARNSGFDWTRQSLVTADMHVRYLGRPKGDHVVARAEIVRVGRMLIVLECKVRDPEGNVIASADFSMMIVPLRGPLTPDAEPPEPGAPEL